MPPITATALGLIDATDELRTLAALWVPAAPWSSCNAFSSSCDRSLGCLVPLLPLVFGVYNLGVLAQSTDSVNPLGIQNPNLKQTCKTCKTCQTRESVVHWYSMQ